MPAKKKTAKKTVKKTVKQVATKAVKKVRKAAKGWGDVVDTEVEIKPRYGWEGERIYKNRLQ